MKKWFFAYFIFIHFNTSIGFASNNVVEIQASNNDCLTQFSMFSNFALSDYWGHRGWAKIFKVSDHQVSAEKFVKQAVRLGSQTQSEIESIERVPMLSLESAKILIDSLGSDAEACESARQSVYKAKCAKRALMIALLNDVFGQKGTRLLVVYKGWLNADHAEESFFAILDLDEREVLVVDSLYNS